MNPEEIKARAEAAHAGKNLTLRDRIGLMDCIVAEYVPALIAEVEQLRAENEHLKGQAEYFDKDIEDLKEAHANKASEWLEALAEVGRLRRILKTVQRARRRHRANSKWANDRAEYLDKQLAAIRTPGEELVEAANPQLNEIAPEFRKYITALAEAIGEDK